jgi:hypothetical protein
MASELQTFQLLELVAAKLAEECLQESVHQRSPSPCSTSAGGSSTCGHSPFCTKASALKLPFELPPFFAPPGLDGTSEESQLHHPIPLKAPPGLGYEDDDIDSCLRKHQETLQQAALNGIRPPPPPPVAPPVLPPTTYPVNAAFQPALPAPPRMAPSLLATQPPPPPPYMPRLTSEPSFTQPAPSFMPAGPVARLELDAVLFPRSDSEALPTIGSAGHSRGSCKPCAFFTTRGCSNGFQCPFCHLCPPGEKKRRQKEKHQNLVRLRQTTAL